PRLNGVRAAFSGADSDDRLDRDRPDLAVADPAGLRRLDHDPDEVVGVLVLAQDLDPDLRHHVDPVLGAAVHLRVPALPAVPARLGDRQAVDAERLERGLDVVQLERLDDSGDELHLVSLRLSCTRPSGTDVSPEGSACVGRVKHPGPVLQPCFRPRALAQATRARDSSFSAAMSTTELTPATLSAPLASG